MVVRFFLDTNVIVQYIIFNQLLNRKESIEKGTPSYQRYEMAHKLVAKIIEFKSDDVLFFISLLIRAEFYYALLEEYKCREMYKGGIPLSSWHINKGKIKLKNEHKGDINTAISKFELKNIADASDKEKKKIWSSWDIYNYPLISALAYGYDIKSHDSILISTAIFNQCDYFITLDQRLRDKFKEHKYTITVNKQKIKFISPDESFEIINKIEK